MCCPADEVCADTDPCERIRRSDLRYPKTPGRLIGSIGQQFCRVAISSNQRSCYQCERQDVVEVVSGVGTPAERTGPHVEFVHKELADKRLFARIGTSWDVERVVPAASTCVVRLRENSPRCRADQ